jgi:Ca2+-binding EF-hand superfamily protein
MILLWFLAAFLSLGYSCIDEDFMELDKDGNGMISLDEFVMAACKKRRDTISNGKAFDEHSKMKLLRGKTVV